MKTRRIPLKKSWPCIGNGWVFPPRPMDPALARLDNPSGRLGGGRAGGAVGLALPPLRTTALDVTAGGGVTGGDARQTQALLARSATPLHQTLAQVPARAEDRLSARMGLLMPVVIAGLSLFWITSGLIGAARVTQAAATLADWPAWLARTSVLAWAVVDVALGAAVLYRPWAKQALWAMVAVCGIYVLSASVFTPPALWLDPLGPLVKILPAALLALVALPMIENR